MPIYLLLPKICLYLSQTSTIMPIYASLIGQLVRKRRKDLHLNQQDLAELAQVTIKTIYAIESNTGNPTIEILERILHVLGLEMKFQIKSIEA